jgi:hypothetical protein
LKYDGIEDGDAFAWRAQGNKEMKKTRRVVRGVEESQSCIISEVWKYVSLSPGGTHLQQANFGSTQKLGAGIPGITGNFRFKYRNGTLNYSSK